jgi:hypothetical protein
MLEVRGLLVDLYDCVLQGVDEPRVDRCADAVGGLLDASLETVGEA